MRLFFKIISRGYARYLKVLEFSFWLNTENKIAKLSLSELNKKVYPKYNEKTNM